MDKRGKASNGPVERKDEKMELYQLNNIKQC
jgi:hypothetical protein